MKDKVSIDRIALLHPKFRDQAAGFIDDIEAALFRTFRIVQGFRSFAQQDAIYAQGRTTPGKIVSYAPAGSSYHNYGVAIDICPFVVDSTTVLDWGFDFKRIEHAALNRGLQCGMDFSHPDMDHFENKFNIGWREMLHRYTMKDFIPGTHFINL